METWFLVVVSACICFLIRAIIINFITTTTHGPRLPPGPPFIPLVTTVSWLVKSFSQIEPVLVGLRAKYGPVITLRITSRPAIFVADRTLAHQALVQKGAVFSDRPPALVVSRIFTSNQHNINSAPYGSTWRTLRRNLASEMLHPNRVKSFTSVRRWVLEVLVNRLKSDSETTNSVRVIDHFHYAMFCLLVFMCFGEKLDEKQVKDVERVQRALLLSTSRFNILNFWEPITRILFRKRWQELFRLMKEQSDVLIPLIRARKSAKEHREGGGGDVVSYVDTLLDLELPEEKRKLNDEEMVTVCSEFLSAGTDTTATALQWIMANVVKYPHVQQRLVEEIRKVKGESREEVKEEELQRMAYLKAVVLEGLRRHPPGHFVLPHTVTEDVDLNGYLIPKKGSVNFMVAQIGLDPEVWEDPLEFKPERFLQKENEDGVPFDITGNKEIRMMPFGAGRRICPGLNLAMLHLEYFVANLVSSFDWKVPEGGSVDLTEKQEFTIVMKNPLHAHITPRI